MVDQLEPFAVSVSEAARLLGVSRPTVYALIHREDFPAFNIGQRTLVSTAGLRAWVDAQAETNDRGGVANET